MDTRWKRFSHSTIAKALALVIAVFCYSGLITWLVNAVMMQQVDLENSLEDNYYQTQSFANDCGRIISNIIRIADTYKSEENILNGGTIKPGEMAEEEARLYYELEDKSINPSLSGENMHLLKKAYDDALTRLKSDLIKRDLAEYRSIMQDLQSDKGILFYARINDYQISNCSDPTREYFMTLPAFLVFDSSERTIYPDQIKDNQYYSIWMKSKIDQLSPQDVLYLGFTNDYLTPRITQWQESKALLARSLYLLAAMTLGLLLSFIYLCTVAGRKPQDGETIHMNWINRIYNDLNLVMCGALIVLWCGFMPGLGLYKHYKITFGFTFVIATLGLILTLSLVKHFKDKTLLTHSLTFVVFHKLFVFLKDIYDNGSVAVKAVVVVIAYPLLVGLTFFIFPITLGAAAWLTLKKVKEFNAISEGVKRVKEGDISHAIDLPGDGELARLAADINSITDGLSNAVEKAVKSERFKSELITNVSHDIRTPLTSIITYIDLMKNEDDLMKNREYLDVLEQKAQRLKILTEDLFEAAKASSGSIPVCYENIEIVSLFNQGLGELDDRIQERKLEFKISRPAEKVYIKADGKLLWRAVENLLSNILKYALEGSRVYVDINDFGQAVQIILKNISAYELNIPSDELMERFTRGDDARSGQGSGLGLSIAKSLIEIQKGSFDIEIDGDLFKAIIQMNKAVPDKSAAQEPSAAE